MTRHELADAMIRGKTAQGVVESKGNYISILQRAKTCYACALGCALIGYFNGDYYKAEEAYDAEYLLRREEDFEHEIFSHILDVPSSIAFQIESKHINGMPIQQIAAWLKSSEGGEA